MLALLGGSFDPVHEGHLRTADGLRRQLGLARLVLLPAARSPLKAPGTADHHRLAMLRLAVQDYPGLVVDDRELQRPPPSYTIDTLRALRAECGQGLPILWVIGSDALASLPAWKAWQDLTGVAHLVVLDRPGYPWPSSGPVADWLARHPCAALGDAGTVDGLQCRAHGNIVRASLPPEPVSSSAIRAGLQSGHRPAGLPERVWHYILDHHLYLSAAQTRG